MVGRAVHLYVEADGPQRGLHRLGQKRQFHTARVGQPTDGQPLAIPLADAIAIGVHPTCGLKRRLGGFGIKVLRSHRGITEGKLVRERARRLGATAAQQRVNESLAVDALADGLAHSIVLHDGRGVVHLAKEHATGVAAVDGVPAAVLEQRVASVRQAIRGVYLA